MTYDFILAILGILLGAYIQYLYESKYRKDHFILADLWKKLYTFVRLRMSGGKKND